MYNIQKAVSRLEFAPKLKEIQVTDIKKGIGVFTPKPDKPVSFAALQTALKKAGYELDSSEINVTGTMIRDDSGWWVVASVSEQRFALEGSTLESMLNGLSSGDKVEVTGAWKTITQGASAREVISPRTMKKSVAPNADTNHQTSSIYAHNLSASSISGLTLSLAPIRTTSPGLTVYKGGAITPRLFFTRQHLGDLEISRQTLQVSLSYTPTPRVQLEVEVPFSRTAFDNGIDSGEGSGLGNITVWSKYRFYRTVETWGDRQAAVRFGLELPIGKKTAPSEQQLRESAFVRQQLTPINGGLSAMFDAAYSQAHGRLIFGGNIEGILRSERDGYRTGHELRINTDLEYVLFPFKYRRPTKELFAILETNFVLHGLGRLDGNVVRGSQSTEYYIAPGLQYVASPQLVIEGSVQLPLIRNTGAQVLRTDHNILLGIKYLF